ncbi:MAG: hexameric tyrosine-coordinated heme protein [Pseudolysinimonas sp.]
MELTPGNTLITAFSARSARTAGASPQEGRELAIAMARKTIGAIQPDAKTRQTPRPGYAPHAEALTMASHVVAVEFATLAAANNYWRDQTS